MEQTTKRNKVTLPDTEYIAIQELKKRYKTSEAIFYGVCTMNQWHPGKQVTEKEYQNAVTMFLNNGVGGKSC